MTDHTAIPWRTGRHVGRTVYAQTGPDATRSDLLIGVMDTPELARVAVDAHNASLTVTDPPAVTAAREHADTRTTPMTDDELETYRELIEMHGAYGNALSPAGERQFLAEVDRLRGQRRDLTRLLDQHRGEAGRAEFALNRQRSAVLELHGVPFCETCNTEGPCETRRALAEVDANSAHLFWFDEDGHIHDGVRPGLFPAAEETNGESQFKETAEDLNAGGGVQDNLSAAERAAAVALSKITTAHGIRLRGRRARMAHTLVTAVQDHLAADTLENYAAALRCCIGDDYATAAGVLIDDKDAGGVQRAAEILDGWAGKLRTALEALERERRD